MRFDEKRIGIPGENLYHLNLRIRGASGRPDDRFERLKLAQTRSNAELAE